MDKKNSMEKSGAFFVGLGIFLSRISGLIRVRIFAHFFGNSDAADAFNAALKIPNFLQNLFGEGVLSASFIPVYAKLVAKNHNHDKNSENHLEAARVASIIGSLLFILVSTIVLLGILTTPLLIELIAPGFEGEKKDLTISIVKIIFPGTGLLVMSAWCLGILNSHKKFFLSYVAPVIWNASIIMSMYLMANSSQFDLALYTAWGLVVGSLLQFLIQLPSALRLVRYFKPQINLKLNSVKTVVKNFFPVVTSRGVIQLSAYIDSILASLLPAGAVSTLAYAQTLYLLPISLFGMSVSASELPLMSSAIGDEKEIATYLRDRLNNGLRKIAFYIIPSSCAFIILGDLLISAVFQSGQFTSEDVKYVWFVLIAATLGLLANTLGRLYSSTFYSLKDTRTPLKFAVLRVIFNSILGYLFAFWLPAFLKIDLWWGTVGIAASSGLCGWIEFYLLRQSLNKKIGITGIGAKYQLVLWVCALCSSFLAWGLSKFNLILDLHYITRAFIVVAVYGCLYFTFTYFFGLVESKNVVDKIIFKIKRLS